LKVISPLKDQGKKSENLIDEDEDTVKHTTRSPNSSIIEFKDMKNGKYFLEID
jgi:hypothetical protein